MERADLEVMRKRIEEELSQCRADIERLEVSASPISPSNALGRLTRMDSMNDQGIAKAALNSNREKLYRLEQALTLIDQPGFGICVSCRRPIPVERLLAVPESTRCVACASG